MTAMTSYNIEVTLPNNTKRTILFNHKPTSKPKSKYKSKENEKPKDYNALVSEHELSAYLYQQLQSDNIDPCTHTFVMTYIGQCQRSPSPPNQSYSRRTRAIQIKLFVDKPTKVRCTSYKVVYTEQTGPAESCKICCCNVGYKSPKLGPDEIAFQLASIERWVYSGILFMITTASWVCGFIFPMDWSYDNLSDNATFIMIGPWAIIMTAMILILFYLSICIPSGRGYLIIDMVDENDPDQDVVYIQTGYCLDRCWNKRHRLDMDKFRGIRIESCYGTYRSIENDEGGACALMFDGDEEDKKENEFCGPNSCGPKSCGDKSWVFVTRSDGHNRVYYEIAKFFKQRYGERDGYDLRFSIPRKLREELRNYGVRDELLNGNGAWKEKEWIDLQIADDEDEDILLLQDGRDDEEIMKQEIRDLIEFVTTEVADDLAVAKESEIIEGVLNDGIDIDQLIESYKDFKKQYSLMYEERESLYTVKLEYSKKIVTLLTFKANEMKASANEVNEKDGAYTISTKIDGDNNCNDGLKDSLL